MKYMGRYVHEGERFSALLLNLSREGGDLNSFLTQWTLEYVEVFFGTHFIDQNYERLFWNF